MHRRLFTRILDCLKVFEFSSSEERGHSLKSASLERVTKVIKLVLDFKPMLMLRSHIKLPPRRRDIGKRFFFLFLFILFSQENINIKKIQEILCRGNKREHNEKKKKILPLLHATKSKRYICNYARIVIQNNLQHKHQKMLRTSKFRSF